MYVLLGYDSLWGDSLQTFMGIFSTSEKAQNVIDQDYWIDDCGKKNSNHEEYEIQFVMIDEEYTN